jgi:hypothetical protein
MSNEQLYAMIDKLVEREMNKQYDDKDVAFNKAMQYAGAVGILRVLLKEAVSEIENKRLITNILKANLGDNEVV